MNDIYYIIVIMSEYIDGYIETYMEIHEEVFDKDFDEVGFEPIEVDDSDDESAELFGYND